MEAEVASHATDRVVFFGYLIVAALFHENRLVRLLMIGPYGISAGIWFGLAICIRGVFGGQKPGPRV